MQSDKTYVEPGASWFIIDKLWLACVACTPFACAVPCHLHSVCTHLHTVCTCTPCFSEQDPACAGTVLCCKGRGLNTRARI